MENTVSNPNLNKDFITQRLIVIVKDMTSDWDITDLESLNRETRLINDLAFESIDIVQLVVAIEQNFNRRGLPFEKVLMTEGRYVDDITLGELSDFLSQYL